MAECRSCNAQVLWALTERGGPIPINPEPDANGNVVLVQPVDPRYPPTARVLRKGEQAPMPRFTSHFSDCEQASMWRKK